MAVGRLLVGLMGLRIYETLGSRMGGLCGWDGGICGGQKDTWKSFEGHVRDNVNGNIDFNLSVHGIGYP